MAVGFLTEQLGANCQVRVRVAWGANINANSSTWAWTDITSDVQQENGKYINISPMGRPPESNQTPPSSVTFTLDNRANLYSKNNPLCANWPNVRQYTPIQVQVTLNGGTNWWTMFQGEASQWQPSWDKTGNYAVVIVTAKGRMQRQNQHKNPLRSAMERYVSTMTPKPIGYWTLEDGPNTIAAQSPIPGVASAVRRYDFGIPIPLPTWGQYPNVAPGSDPGANFQNGGTVIAPITGGVAGTTGWTVAWSWNYGSTAQPTDSVTPLVIYTGTDHWNDGLDILNSTFNLFYSKKTATGSAGTPISFPTWLSTFVPFDDAQHISVITAVQSGANVNWTYKIYKDDTTVFSFSGTIAGYTLQAITSVSMGNDFFGTTFPWTMQHVMVWNGFNVITPDTLMDKLYGDRSSNETPKARALRLCGEEGVEFTTDGFYDSSVIMGPQPSKPFMDNLRQCEATGDDFMYDGLNAGISYQGLSQRNDQATAITVAITDLAKEFDPLDNDLNSINTVRVDRDKGSFFIGTRATGILGSGPDGIGTVDGQVTISNNDDDVLPHRANWETWKGTNPGFRYPIIYLDVAARPTLAAKWITRSDGGTGPVTPGSKLVITSPASYATQHPIEQIELCIESLAMRISRFMWQIDCLCSNNHMYDVNKVGDTALGNLETAGSNVATAASTSATTLIVASKDENGWSTTGGDYPKSIYVDGIKCSLTAVAAPGSILADTFTRTAATWGNADTGQAWTSANVSAGEGTTNGTSGLISNATVNLLRSERILLDSNDCDFTVDNSLPITSATGASITQWVLGRMLDLSNHYIAQWVLATSGAVSLALTYRSAGSLGPTLASTTLAAAHVSGSVWRIRLQVYGSSIKAKAWVPASGGEPGWQLSVTDTTLTAGTNIGIMSRLESGNTNTLPVVSTWDNLQVTNPQKFTITGLTKPAVVGRDVHLWTPGALRL
jgi:hypothetical protein